MQRIITILQLDIYSVLRELVLSIGNAKENKTYLRHILYIVHILYGCELMFINYKKGIISKTL